MRPAFHAAQALPHPPPRRPSLHSQRPPLASAHLPRRVFLALPLVPLLPLVPVPAHSRARRPLAVCLAPLQNLRTTLAELAEAIEQGTIGDIRRVVKTVLIGADLPNNLREAVEFLPRGQREGVLSKGREAYEYLNQVVEYYDPVDVKRKPGGELMAFCLNAVNRAEGLLVEVLEAFEGVAG